MKKTMLLTFLSFSGLGLLSFIFINTEGTLSQNHQAILNLFGEIKEQEILLDKNILEAQKLTVLNYDGLVMAEAKLNSFCSTLIEQKKTLFNNVDEEIYQSIDGYCKSTEDKFADIEEFKSKNSIIRNSIYFVNLTASSMLAGHHHSQDAKNRHALTLVMATVSFYLTTTSETKAYLESLILHRHSGSNFELLYDHSRRIYENKEKLDQLAKKILSEKNVTIEELRDIYFRSFAKSEQLAVKYRFILFVSCLLLLGFILLNIVLLLRSAKKLSDANLNLETKVTDRTKELQNSQQTILEQQQVVILSAKMSALGEMAGGVAHEINTPLAIIAMRTEQLEESLDDGSYTIEEARDTLSVIKKTTDRIAKIINGLRTFARDGTRLSPVSTSIYTVIEDTLSLCSEKFRNAGVILETPKDALPLDIRCRPIEISQVLLNLLNNAYDAIKNDEEKWVRLVVQDQDSTIEISVTDSGQGIPIEIRDKLMNPFFTTKEIGKGTGMGLSISKGIIESHGGKLFLDTNSEKTKFTIQLPKEIKEKSIDLTSMRKIS